MRLLLSDTALAGIRADSQQGIAPGMGDVQLMLMDIGRLKAEIEELRENARRLAFIFMGEVDDGIESLELDGRHSDSGYKKLKRLHRVAYRFVRRFVPLIKASQP
jgi:hypothetical protein